MRPRRGMRDNRREEPARDFSLWAPRTELGKRVKSGEISSMRELMKSSAPIKEVEIIDKLLPEMGEEVIDVGRVQRVTDSGRKMRFRVVMAVGNNNGYVGVDQVKGKEAGPTIRKAIEKAKLNIKQIKRGCGSWECGCNDPHTVPFKVVGKSGSVEVELSPAPKGTGLVSGEIAKKILSLAGISDVWVHTRGHTRSSINFAHAVLDALVNTNKVKIKEGDIEKLGIISGSVVVKKEVKEEDEKAKEGDASSEDRDIPMSSAVVKKEGKDSDEKVKEGGIDSKSQDVTSGSATVEKKDVPPDSAVVKKESKDKDKKVKKGDVNSEKEKG